MKTKMSPHWNIFGENRLVVSSLTQITIVGILIAVKSDRVCSTPFAVLCFSWDEITPKWITKEKGKVLLWAEVHNLRCRYVNNDCNYCKGSRCCLCWLQNHGHCPWSLTIPVAAYLVANQQEIVQSLGAIWLVIVSRKLYSKFIYRQLVGQGKMKEKWWIYMNTKEKKHLLSLEQRRYKFEK